MKTIKVSESTLTVIMMDSLPIVHSQDRELMGDERPRPFHRELKDHAGGYYVHFEPGEMAPNILNAAYQFHTPESFKKTFLASNPSPESWFEVSRKKQAL